MFKFLVFHCAVSRSRERLADTDNNGSVIIPKPVCVYVSIHLCEDQFEFKTFRVKTSLQIEDVLASPDFGLDLQRAV